MKIALRMDDITADMDWDKFKRLKALFDQYGIKPLLGVVPDNQDDHLKCGPARPDFWEYLAGLQKEGWVMAQHGWKHVYRTRRAGVFPLNGFSEFAGLSFEEQKKCIEDGRRRLEKNGIRTDIFMAPGHSFDRNTLRALRECGFRAVTDGFGRYPYKREGLIFYPIARKKSASFGPKEGYTTLVLHANEMTEEEIGWYERMLARYGTQFLSYGQLMEVPVKERGFAGNLAEYLTALCKRWAVRLLGMLKGRR